MSKTVDEKLDDLAVAVARLDEKVSHHLSHTCNRHETVMGATDERVNRLEHTRTALIAWMIGSGAGGGAVGGFLARFIP